jgi:superfamily II DNA or RNA helicase
VTSYADFLATKQKAHDIYGREVTPAEVHPMLHEWQAELVIWAARVGRCAIWADTGLGKTVMQIEWARLTGERSLIIAPLAVCAQTVREAAKLGIVAMYARNDSEAIGPGLWVTNYERVQAFDPDGFQSVVLDEASILKQSDGKTRTALIAWASTVAHRLACTATPAPNDVEELTSQAEWVGASTRVNMLASYFVHDSDTGWRLKGHARRPMMRWMSGWAVALRRPSDLGYDDAGYDLPGLDVISHLIDTGEELTPDDQLFATDLGGVGGRARVRRATLDSRVERVAELVALEAGEPWVLWCGLNDEASSLAKIVPGAVNVQGSDSPEDKAAKLLAFADGDIRVLVTKPSMAAFGLNWQHCARMAFVGLNDSYEAYYQAIRRCYRYGQKRPVHAHVVLSDLEGQIAVNIARKERQASSVLDELVREMRNATEKETVYL